LEKQKKEFLEYQIKETEKLLEERKKVDDIRIRYR